MQLLSRVPRSDVALGFVCAAGVQVAAPPPDLEARLAELLSARQAGLSGEEEEVRQAVRDILRNGRYKPTGRGKPASEYLLREAQTGLPRINVPVDVCNYISLAYLLPVSLWDLDRAASTRYVFRLGRAGESYVFNEGGQVIELEDLIVGCRVGADPAGEPIVNPVKDSQATKTSAATTRVAACVYAPLAAVSPEQLAGVCETFAAMLAACGEEAVAAHGLALPGSACTLQPLG